MPYFIEFSKKYWSRFSMVFPYVRNKKYYPWYVLLFFLTTFTVLCTTLGVVPGLDDPLFHIRFTEILRNQGWSAFTNFDSIYFSKIGIGHAYLVYYNFLFYVLMLPFTYISPLAVGINYYIVSILTLTFMMLYWFLRSLSIRYAFLWVLFFLLVLMQSAWLPRFFEARPFAFTPAILVLMLMLLSQRRYGWAAVLSFGYFFWHTATFPFPVCLAIAYFLFEQFYGKSPDWKLVVWPTAGLLGAVLVAYLISPGVVAYLRDVIYPVFFDTSIFKTTNILEGSEVYGRDFFSILGIFMVPLSLFVILGCYEVWRYVQAKRTGLGQDDAYELSVQPMRMTLFGATLVFILGSVLSARFLDYFVFFCFLYIVIAGTQVSQFIEIKGRLFRRASAAGLLVLISYLFVHFFLASYDRLASTPSYLMSAGPTNWLLENVTRGSLVFNVDWDAFPQLYFFTGDTFRYIAGLEPRFLHDYDEQLYWKWNTIGYGVVCDYQCSDAMEKAAGILANEKNRDAWRKQQGELIADTILRDFHTDIIVLGNQRQVLLDIMDHSDRFKKEYMDTVNSRYAIYRILTGSESERSNVR